MIVYKLQDCCTIIAGQSPESKYYNTDGIGLPFFQGKSDFGELCPTVRTYCSKPAKIAEKDDILLSVRAPVGPTNLSPGTVCIGRGLAAIRPSEMLNLRYLLCFFRYFEGQLQQRGTGTTFKAITMDVVKNLEVPAPSISDQKRIVARIEELFSELDKAVETLNTTKQQLAVYRQAVLKEAFGNLTNTISISEIAVMIDPQPSHRTPAEVAGGVPYIGVGDIDYTNNEIVFDKARKVSPLVLTEHCERYKLNNGDFIMGKIGTIGKPFRVQLPQNYALSANVILIQPDSKKIMPDFLFWQFSSPLITQQLEKGTTATSQPAFGIKKARALSIRICEYNRQAQIVENIESRLSVCEQIEKTIDQTMQKAKALRQSILKQAFEGRLI